MATVDPAVVVYQIFNDVIYLYDVTQWFRLLAVSLFSMVREREETGARVFDETHSLSV